MKESLSKAGAGYVWLYVAVVVVACLWMAGKWIGNPRGAVESARRMQQYDNNVNWQYR